MGPTPDQSLITHPLHVARQAALVGAGCGVPGLAIGATYGTLRTQTPVLFSLFSGAQCFTIGTTFYTIRSTILNQDGLKNWFHISRGTPTIPRTDLDPSPSDRVRASTIAGACTGFSLGFLFRGPKNVIPGTVMFSLFGYGGQHAYNWLDRRNSDAVRREQGMKEKGEEKVPFVQRILKSKWSPLKELSDEEYENLIREKLLGVEAEIALIDDKIEGLRKKQKELNAQKTSNVQDRPQKKELK